MKTSDELLRALKADPDFDLLLRKSSLKTCSADRDSEKDIFDISLEGRKKYEERCDKNLGVIEFLRSEYADLMQRRILTLPIIGSYDPKLYAAIYNHIKTRALPCDVVILTKKDANDFYLAKLEFGLPIPRQVAYRLRHVRYDRKHPPKRTALD